MEFGPLTFLAPLGLLGLLSLPLIYWLLRATPPQPKDQTFPPLQILRGAELDEETPDRTPLWLLLFRILMVALLAIALANPILKSATSEDVRDVVIVMDDGYAAAANWSQMIGTAENRIKQARRENAQVMLLHSGSDTAEFVVADAALDQLDTLTPSALVPERGKLAELIDPEQIESAELLYLSDGLSYNAETESTFLDGLRAAEVKKIFRPGPERQSVFAGTVQESADGFSITYHRADGSSQREISIIALSKDSRIIGQADALFELGERQVTADFVLPADLRNQVSLIRVEGLSSAGSVKLLDDAFGRPIVGIIASADDNAQPLLSEVFYAEKALQPYADIFKAPLEDLLSMGPSILIMTDSSRIESEQLEKWVEEGGLLIRFAGPKLAARADTLLPVQLRFGDRALGGTLTWEEPQTLEPFEIESPFFGLSVPTDVEIRTQVMAESGIETDNRTWARLSDGSPVVTSATRGNGRIVLFHVTSSPEWSNLAISGLYVNMLRRILPLSRRLAVGPSNSEADWAPERVLDGFGRLSAPAVTAKPVPDAEFDTLMPNAVQLPGLYRQGQRVKALNVVAAPKDITTLNPSGLTPVNYGGNSLQSLMGLLLAIGLTMLAIDALLAVTVTGRWGRLKLKPVAATLALGVMSFALMPADSHAQNTADSVSNRILDDALNLRFAYVLTGDNRIDDSSDAGMRGLTYELNRRTTVEPEEPRGVNIETDDLSPYPLIYWPVTRSAPELSPQAAANVNGYLASGGTIIFDTQDYGDQSLFGNLAHPGMEQISKSIDIPRLIPIPEDHVLTRTYFLLQVFPGRWSGGQLWVDAENIGARDGVASVIVGSNDWATGWAMDADDNYIGEVEDTLPKHREMAKRFSVNLGMYVLAGNYKTDQVHAPAILERLRPDRDEPREGDNIAPEELAPEPEQ